MVFTARTVSEALNTRNISRVKTPKRCIFLGLTFRYLLMSGMAFKGAVIECFVVIIFGCLLTIGADMVKCNNCNPEIDHKS